jgi:hypothetical protein
MAMNAAQQAQFQQLLGQHDNIRRSTEMPLFYGDKSKDVCSALYLVDRLENARRIAAWPNDERACNEFYACLRGKALVWWDSLKDHGVATGPNDKVWADIKKAFLKAYDPKYSPKLTVTNFGELVQKNNESVHDFYLRISEICRKMFHGRPEALFNIKTDYPNAGANAYDLNIVKAIKKEGLEDDEMYIKHQIFIAGIKEELRCKVIEENKATLGESVYFAIELESILNEKRAQMKLNAIEDIDESTLTEEERNAINALRFKRKGNGGSFQKRMPPKANATTICRYCKKNGHFQKDCRSRIRDKAPMVDAQGKPYAKKINPIHQDEEIDETRTDWNEESQVIGSIAGKAVSLNWL